MTTVLLVRHGLTKLTGPVLAGWTRASAQFARGDAESAKWLAPIADHWATTAGRDAAAANEAIPRVRLRPLIVALAVFFVLLLLGLPLAIGLTLLVFARSL